MPVETLGPRLDLAQIEAGLKVEVIDAGAVLKIEIYEANGGRVALAAEKRKRRLNRERRHADAAGGGEKSIDLRFDRLSAGGTFGGARAGADEIDRRHRLHQEIGDPDLQQLAGDHLIESLRHDDQGRRAAEPVGEALKCYQLVLMLCIEIDDDDGRVAGL